MILPRIFLFQHRNTSNSRLLRYVKEDGANHGFLQVVTGSIQDPCSRFTVERAKSGDGLVHIRCNYNNKYLVRQSNTSTWIVASADDPEEDRSKWSCTLFSPIAVPSLNSFRFMLVQNQRYLNHGSQSGAEYLQAAGLFSGMAYVTIDWETLFIMPKYVSFKGDNGRYLRVTEIFNGRIFRYLQFSSEEKEDPLCWFEVITTNDGNIHLKSVQTGTFWTQMGDNWISVSATESTSENLFWATKVDSNVIALRNNRNGNIRYCERAANITGSMRDCLRATQEAISQTTRFVVEEAVLSRRIDNVIYRLMDSRVYNERALIVASNEAVNKTEEEHDMELHFSYSESTSSTWNAAVSGSFGIEASFRAGIPFLAQKQITISIEISGGYEWGKTIEQSTEVSTTYNVIVPPKTKVIVRLLATEASFDVPFSYVQRDTLLDGREVISEIDGGMFNGVNSYNFRYEIEEQKLDPTELMQQEKTSKMVGLKAKLPSSAL